VNEPTQADAQVGEDLGPLYAREHARLWRAVFAFSHDREVASNAVAEAFAQLIRRGSDVRDPRAWVWRAAFALARGELRARGRRPALVNTPPDRPEVEAPSPSDRVMAALRALSPNQRAAVVLFHYGGYGTDDIARIIGAGRATVRVHLSRGRRRLRSLLEGGGDG
jgi:RNA polymerase sigma-70 factor (ECF subfamily)